MQNFKEKVVAVTGASAGIGKVIAIKLAKNGVKVVLGARNTEQLKNVVEEIKNNGGEAVFVKIDENNKADLVQLVNVSLTRQHNNSIPTASTIYNLLLLLAY
ncbi:SDR family NAD(P)-dependent oxidoreductase [Flavobacterium algicola]|uniref:SDR family NAD(P)-dependent oxidoreductase n=1 Tax=Flavobacterium algicola TaxID=556529 RepID=UPI001EFC75D0|nr:SDR family NAD(P)-dependent oxidoreductase [Flavobacterium algicola]MCG9793764.1 SDR family NAD(P)-dependent oxidoreductase [Flavobacterium algicola]